MVIYIYNTTTLQTLWKIINRCASMYPEVIQHRIPKYLCLFYLTPTTHTTSQIQSSLMVWFSVRSVRCSINKANWNLRWFSFGTNILIHFVIEIVGSNNFILIEWHQTI